LRRRGRARAGSGPFLGDGVAGAAARALPAARIAGRPHETRVAGERHGRHRARPGDLLRGLETRLSSGPPAFRHTEPCSPARRRRPGEWSAAPALGASPRNESGTAPDRPDYALFRGCSEPVLTGTLPARNPEVSRPDHPPSDDPAHDPTAWLHH